MTLRTRTLLIVGLALAASLVLSYAAASAIVSHNVRELESSALQQDLERVRGAVARELDALDVTTADWAYWDETYAFVQDVNPAYVESNLDGSAFANLGVSLMVFVDPSGEVVFSRACDPESGVILAQPAGLEAYLFPQGPLGEHAGSQSGAAGLVILQDGGMLVASRPILTSQQTGPFRGSLIVGRWVDAAWVQRLSEITQLNLSLHLADDAGAPSDVLQASASLSSDSPEVVERLGENLISGYALLNDVKGQPGLIARVEETRPIHALGKESIRQVLYSLLLIGAVLGTAYLMTLERFVLSRISLLSREMAQVSAGGDLTRRVSASGQDELSRLAVSINDTLASFERSQAERHASEERFRALFETAPDGIFIKDRDLRYVHVNPAMERILGLPASEVIGKTDDDLFCGEEALVLRADDPRVLDGETVQAERSFKTRSANLSIRVTAAPMRDSGGKVLGLCGIVHDVTHRKVAEDRLRETEERYHALFEASTDAVLVYSQDGSLQDFNATACDILGYTPDELAGLNVRDLVPQDVSQDIPAVLSDLALEGGRRLESFGKRKSGEVFPAEVSIRGVTVQGQVLGVAYLRDVTERKVAEEALRRSEERLRTLIESQGEGTVIVDDQDRFVFANPAAERIFGVRAGELVGRSLETFATPESYVTIRRETARRQKGVRSSYEAEILRPDGERRVLMVTATPRLNADGEFVGTVGVFRDVTDRKRMEERLQHLSTHDPVTGIYNRTYFDEELVRLERGRRYPISVVVVDLDQMKEVNDQEGHAAGDRLLQRAAEVLRGSFRGEDVVARIGGDEFAVLLPGADERAAQRAVDRVRARLEAYEDDLPGRRLRLSIGAATGDKGRPLSDVLHLADQRMCEDKARRAAMASPARKKPRKTAQASKRM